MKFCDRIKTHGNFGYLTDGVISKVVHVKTLLCFDSCACIF